MSSRSLIFSYYFRTAPELSPTTLRVLRNGYRSLMDRGAAGERTDEETRYLSAAKRIDFSDCG